MISNEAKMVIQKIISAGTKEKKDCKSDMDGKKITLSTYRGKKNVVLVFYRGYW